MKLIKYKILDQIIKKINIIKILNLFTLRNILILRLSSCIMHLWINYYDTFIIYLTDDDAIKYLFIGVVFFLAFVYADTSHKVPIPNTIAMPQEEYVYISKKYYSSLVAKSPESHSDLSNFINNSNLNNSTMRYLDEFI
jgi:hypothetical protein